jgi:hypothetical protein
MNLLHKIIPSFLCCVIAIGYAPAWLHKSTCHSDHAVGSSAQSTFHCLGGCSHSKVNLPPDLDLNGPEGTENKPAEQQHDSETCFICQSLGSANGVTSHWDTPVEATIAVEPSSIPNESNFVGPSLSVVQPRGPPVRV